MCGNSRRRSDDNRPMTFEDDPYDVPVELDEFRVDLEGGADVG
jgi:hypothetical protein